MASSWGSATLPTNEYLYSGLILGLCHSSNQWVSLWRPCVARNGQISNCFLHFLFYHDFIMISWPGNCHWQCAQGASYECNDPPPPETLPLCEASIACQEDHSTPRLGHGCNAHRAFNAVTSTKFQNVLNYFSFLSIVPVRENKKRTSSAVFVFFSSPGWKEKPGG